MLLFLRKFAKFRNVYSKVIRRRNRKKYMDGGYHENIGNKRKKLNNIGNVGGFVNT